MVNERWLITAGHCCVHRRTTVQISHNDIKFNVGAHLDQTCSFSNRCCIYEGEHGSVIGTVVATNEIVLHPDYNKGLDWDFCLAKVEKITIDGTTVKPVTLPNAHVLPSIVTAGEASVPRECWVMGWGETEDRVQSATLLAASVKIMSESYCKAFGGRYSGINSEFQFCAGKRHDQNRYWNEDSCTGDSGGPLVCSDGNNLVQYGIVSRGGRRCGDTYQPGVYSKISSVLPWIQEVTGKFILKM